MKTKLMLVIAGTALMLSASAVSELGFLRPFFTAADRVSDPQLAGSWAAGDDEAEAVVIRDLGDAEYAVELDVFGPLSLRAHLVHLGEFRFLDLTAMKPEVSSGSYTLLPAPHVTRAGDVFLALLPPQKDASSKNLRVEILPWRLLCRIRLEGDVLHVACAEDGEWLQEAIARGEITVDEEREVVTTSTEELRKFVLRHAQDEGIFRHTLDLHRRRTAPETGKP